MPSRSPSCVGPRHDGQGAPRHEHEPRGPVLGPTSTREAQEAEDPVLKALVGGSTASPRASKAAVGQ